MKLKVLISSVMVLCLSIGMTGCSNYDEIERLNNLQSLNSESSVDNNYNLSYTDEQEMVYAQVSDRTLLDLSTLEACNESELQQVLTYMDGVDEQLCGKIDSEHGVIEDKFINYLLFEFEKTPYQWQRTKTTVRGIDAKSKSIIVDVNYNTINFEKDVIGESKIPKGTKNYTTLASARLAHYMEYLNAKLGNLGLGTTSSARIDTEKLYKQFVDAYGDPEEIIKSQKNETLAETIYDTGIQITYDGCIDNEVEKSSASMSVRYTLVPNYKLGINLGLSCKHLYVTNYKLDVDPTENRDLFLDDGYQTVTSNIYKLIYSYFTCIDESDFGGLCELTHNFGTMDKYYSDYFDYVYRKHNNFTLSVFNIQGTHIECGVAISSKLRCKGSEMTYPSYTDRYYVEIEFVDDDLKIVNMALLSRVLESEPAIATTDADLAGFTAEINLTNEDKVAIENLICNFSAVQLLKDTTSDKFGDVVDLAMTTSELSQLQTNMTSLEGVKKVVWLENYQQGSTNYASVKCKEHFQNKDNGIIEAEAVYDFILKGNKWYIFKYNVNSSVTLDTTNLVTTGSLCLCSPGSVDSYTSQIKSTVSDNLDEVADVSVVVDHEVYTPTRKTGKAETGKVKITLDTFNEVDYEYLLAAFDGEIPPICEQPVSSFDDFKRILLDAKKWGNKDKYKDLGLSDDFYNKVLAFQKECYLYKTNVSEDKYSSKEKMAKSVEMNDTLNNLSNEVRSISIEGKDEEFSNKIDELVNELMGIANIAGVESV